VWWNGHRGLSFARGPGAPEMRVAYYKERRTDAGAGAEAQRTFGMFDRSIGVASPIPEDGA
jgi:hypothetical protein